MRSQVNIWRYDVCVCVCSRKYACVCAMFISLSFALRSNDAFILVSLLPAPLLLLIFFFIPFDVVFVCCCCRMLLVLITSSQMQDGKTQNYIESVLPTFKYVCALMMRQRANEMENIFRRSCKCVRVCERVFLFEYKIRPIIFDACAG